MVKQTSTNTASEDEAPSVKLLFEIEGFLKEFAIGESYFGKAACGNSELIARLRSGGECRHASIVQVRRFMAERRAARDNAGTS